MKKKRKTKNPMGKLMLVTLLSLFCSYTVMAQKTKVSGTITGSDDGQPLPGVTVVVKGTTNGTVSDLDGKYSISVQSGDILKFSFVGMTTKEITYSGKSVINVELENDAVALEDVVVVGYGKQKRESVVGSISKATGEQIRQAGSVSTVSEALAGILPGVTVTQDAGMPGVSDATILIRGVSTWAAGGNKPLYMVDGVERDFNNIDPNEIESISVLKDASATAVFGLKAANGVILITTKRGLTGKPKVDITANFGVKYPSLAFEYDKDYANVLRYQNMANMNDYNYSVLNPQSKIDTWADPNRDPDFYSYTFWGEELIKSGYTQQYNINLSGGNEFVKYFTSLGYYYDGDVFDIKEQPEFDPRTYQKRYNWRSNLDFQFTNTTKLAVNLSGDYRDWNGNSVTESMYDTGGYGWGGGNRFRNLFTTVMIGPAPILSDGRFGIEEGVASPPSTALTDMAYTGQNMRRSNRIYTDFVLEQDIFDGLKLTGKLSFNYERAYKNKIWLNEIFFYPDYVNHTIKPFEPEGRRTVPKVGNEEIAVFDKTLYYDIRLNYNKKINNIHEVGLLALFSRRNAQGGVNFPYREESWVGRATYGLMDRYFVEFNGAYNGNENWAPGLKFGFFPSGAVGWLVSEENFMKNNLPFIEYFKIRYSYGIVGSDSGIGGNRFTYMSQFNTGDGGINWVNKEVYFGEGASVTKYSPIYVEGIPANPENTWEEAIKQNIGFELATLDGKLSVEVDLFDEQRSGILMQRTVPSWFGNSSPYANIGKTKNHGIDISLKYNGSIAKELHYNITGNLSLSENRIVEMDDAPFAEEKYKMAGRPIGMASGIIGVGFMNSWDDVYNTTADNQASTIIRPGDYMWVDMNGDGVISNEDYARILNPSYAANSYAFTLGLSYKNFRLQGMFNGVFNVTRKLDSKYQFALNESELLTPEQKDSWTVDNMDAETPRLTFAGSYSKRNETTYNLYDSSFLRLRTLELNYTVGKGLRDRLGLFSNLELYVNGHNLFVWSKLPKAFDPESAELQAYPIPKTYNIGLRLGL